MMPYFPAALYMVFAVLLGVSFRLLFALSDRFTTPLAQLLIALAKIALLWLANALLLHYNLFGTEYAPVYLRVLAVSMMTAALAACIQFFKFIIQVNTNKRELTEAQKSELMDM